MTGWSTAVGEPTLENLFRNTISIYLGRPFRRRIAGGSVGAAAVGGLALQQLLPKALSEQSEPLDALLLQQDYLKRAEEDAQLLNQRMEMSSDAADDTLEPTHIMLGVAVDQRYARGSHIPGQIYVVGRVDYTRDLCLGGKQRLPDCTEQSRSGDGECR